jgi:DNA-binding MarR family transcriptional regulator
MFNWRRLRDPQPLAQQGPILIEVGADRRERQVTLTPQREKVLAQAFPLSEKAQARVAHGLGQEQLQWLLEDLAATVAVARVR